MPKPKVVEQCGHCGAGFTTWRQRPPCGMECPYHRDFRIRESAITNSILRLGGGPLHHPCGFRMTPIDETIVGQDNNVIELTWRCVPCGLSFAVGDVMHSR